MLASDAEFLDVLASCLGAGVPLEGALARIEPAGAEASRWVGRIRPLVGVGARPAVSIAEVLQASSAIDGAERALLALAVTPDEVEAVLHAFALRRRQRARRRRAIQGGLIGPFAIAVLTVVLDPLPNLLGSGSYVGPVFRGLLELGLVTAFLLAGVPAALRSPVLAPRLLASCANVPGLAWLAARQAEAELVTMSAPFAARADADSEPLLAVAATLAWSPLGRAIRGARPSREQGRAPERTGTGASPGGEAQVGERFDWALLRQAPHLSLATNLAIVSGIATGRLAACLRARGDEIAARLTTHLRLGVRVLAYVLVAVLSLESLVGMLSRAMPGGGFLPGGAPSAEQKELEEIMRELGGSPPAKPPK